MTGRKWLGAVALLATLISYSSYASGPVVKSAALGMVIMPAPSAVLINGAPARSGAALFPGDVLATLQASTAQVMLRSGASLALSENSEVALGSTDSATGVESLSLRRGAIHLRSPRPQAEWVKVPGGAAVRVQGEGGFPAVCRIAAVGDSSAIINDRGRVEIHGSGAPLMIPMGQHATLEAGRPQASGGQAGAVTAEIPRGNVQRSGQTTAIPLKLSDSVYFNDLVQTEALGRVRIQLTDGSLLNIGARSQMRITKHDPQTHQTVIELTAGKLRSQVTPTQGGTFEVRTQTAVIGVVGTHFLVAAESKRTRVWCFEGMVNVHNLNAAVVGVILLHAGEFTTIPLGLPPAAAASFAPSVMQAQVSQTNAAAPSAGASGASMGSMTTAANVGTTGASGAAAGTAGVAMSRADSASTLLSQAGSTLNTATTTLNTANTNASNAVSSANNANQTTGSSNGVLTGVIQDIISPTYPCGCQ